MCLQCGGEGFEVTEEEEPALQALVRVSEQSWASLVEGVKLLNDDISYELAVAKVQARIGFLLGTRQLDSDEFLWTVASALVRESGKLPIQDMPPMVTTEKRG